MKPAAKRSARTAADLVTSDAIIASAFAALDAEHPGGALGVAVSGGGDSVALMLLANEWARSRGASLRVATVDHGLRSESGAEARAVETAARGLGLPVETLRWNGWDGSGNLQNSARRARKALLADWAVRRGLGAVALGHTMDDQAETVLLRLGRGSGVDGLSAMSVRSDDNGLTWLRPLLALRRDALRDWLRARGAAWTDDPSNDDLRFDRVKARQALPALAPLGVTVEGLAATAARLGEARDALDDAAAALATEAVSWGACGEVRLNLPRLRGAPPELSRRLFRATLTRVAGAEYGPRADAEAAALSAMFSLRLGGGRSLHGCVIRPDGPSGAVITREASAVAENAMADGLWDGRFEISLAPGGANASIGPVGMTGDRRISDLAADGALSPPDSWRRAPKAARITTPALWRGDELAAAPLAGFGEGMTARFAARDPLNATG